MVELIATLFLFFIVYRRIYFSLIFLKYFECCNEFDFTRGQFSDRNTADFILSLSCSSSLQPNSMWSTVCSAFLQ